MTRVKHKKISAFGTYLDQILSYRYISIPALLLPGIGVVFTSYIPPLLIANMIRAFDGKIPSDFHDVLPYILLFMASWMFGEILWRIAFLMLNKTDANGIRKLYYYAIEKMLEKDADFFNNNFAGSLTKKVISFSKSYEGFIDTISFSIIGNLLPLVFASIILWTISPLLVVALFTMLSLTLFAVFPFVKRRRELTVIREAKSNVTAGHVADVIANMSVVQTYAHEDKEYASHKVLVDDYVHSAKTSWDYHTTHVDMMVAPLYVITNTLGLILALTLTHNAATMAAVFITFSYFGQATRILFEFNRTYRNIENALSEAGQFTDLLQQEPSIQENPHAKNLVIDRGEVVFYEVDFAYPDTPDDLLFDHFNLTIKAGEKVAFVGHSGGGKSTITKLLLRLVDISSGSLTIDGQPIVDATFKSLRGQIAYVPQDPSMFHRSIMENIRYGRLDATDEEVYAAAKKAHAVEFIEKLPHGYETLVGERGVKLSGGQRQRIAIARAILKDAPILILDEATSALDSESEGYIQDALEKLMKNRTAIVIAHRLSTIAKLDRIVVLENGMITEDGSHAELLKNDGGIYAKLWAHQSGGFIED